MKKIIVTDVFGKTPALIELGDEIGADQIIDPYDSKAMRFDNETQAYRYFTENVGLDTYVNKVSKIIKNSSDETTLIGFSVGASAIWLLSTSEKAPKIVKHATCFYGSQIRHFTQLSPTFELKLIFPKSEPHFDVLALRLMLADKPKVTAIQVDFLHGFMNYHSSNFNQAGYQLHLELLQQDIARNNSNTSYP